MASFGMRSSASRSATRHPRKQRCIVTPPRACTGSTADARRARSFRPYTARFDDPGVLRDLTAQMRPELGRTGARGVDAEPREALLRLGQAQYPHELPVEPVDDLGRRARRRIDAEPRSER